VVRSRLAAEPKLANRRYKPPDADALPPALQVIAHAKEVSHPDSYGSLRFALKNPEMFAAVALVSPAIYVPEPPETSSARRVGVFGAEQYDPEVWKSLNYPTLLDAFLAKKISMPVHFSSGDHDDFQIEYHATNLYKVWRDNKIPAELRIIDGAHNWDAFKQLLPDAMRYVFQTVRRPELVNGASQ
ncbi:alpha/beta hydrolase-fold protein, partial [Microvirga tunisiensis]|uniref:alpha/beta hydrolase-fold protein n=1 Tax=Microvirga tunisiensis TaxID=2108360 RepID=UPI001FCEC283